MFKKDHNYSEFNSYDLLKFIAITTMIIDHLGFFFFPNIEILRAIGRIAYPLFIFCVGYNQKYSFDYRLLMLGLLMLFFNYICNINTFNPATSLLSSILFSIIITRLVMHYLVPIFTDRNIYMITFLLWCMNFITFQFFQYGTAGIVIAICGYLIRNNTTKLTNNSLFLLINLFIYAAFEAIKMKFSLIDTSLLFIEFFILFRILEHFKIYPISVKTNYTKLILPVSRNSLIIYFVHYELFYLLHKII